jgi:hypothetical protein
MKAKIDVGPYILTERTKRGMFRSDLVEHFQKYMVNVYLEFSEEERAILTQYNLWDTPVWIQPARITQQTLELERLLGKEMISNDKRHCTENIQRIHSGMPRERHAYSRRRVQGFRLLAGSIDV